MIRHVLGQVDSEVRKSISTHIILTGGTSALKGFPKRLGKTLDQLSHVMMTKNFSKFFNTKK